MPGDRLGPTLVAATVGLALAAPVARGAPARLTEPAIRAFIASQEKAWNAKDARVWAAAFTPDARFVDQARGSDNSVVPNGTSTLAQATAQAERFFAKSSFHETAEVTRIEIAADGRSARVLAREQIRIDQPGRAPRVLCTETEHRLVLAGGRILSRGQTDTSVRCNAAPASAPSHPN
jgi:ketosteroid isomerase-like protein